jgi:hypothetical protein
VTRSAVDLGKLDVAAGPGAEAAVHVHAAARRASCSRQGHIGIIRLDWLSHHDLRPHTSRQLGPPRSWLTSHVTAECRAPVAQPYRSVVPFIALTRSIPEMGLMRRSYGDYSAKLIGALVILAAWVVVFILIGDSWWQLAEREYPLTSRLRQRGHGESWMFPNMATHVSQAGRVRAGRRPCRDRRVASTAWSKQRDFLPTNRFGWTPRRR